LGIERWGQGAGALAALLNKHPDSVSRWVSHGACLRAADAEFARAIEELDKNLSERMLERVSKGERTMD
jgi:hypothetical protein